MTTATSTIVSTDASRIIQRRYAVVALYGLSAFWGVAQLIAPGNAPLNVAGALAFAVSATLWFSTDRRILGKPQLPILQFLFFFSWPVASLIHLVTSRGLRGFGYWLLHSVGLFVTLCLTFFPTMFLLYWTGVLDLDAMTKT